MPTTITTYLLADSPHAAISAVRISTPDNQRLIFLDPIEQLALGRMLDNHAICELAYLSPAEAACVAPTDPQDFYRGSMRDALDEISHSVAALPLPWHTNNESFAALEDAAIAQHHTHMIEVLNHTVQCDVTHFDGVHQPHGCEA